MKILKESLVLSKYFVLPQNRSVHDDGSHLRLGLLFKLEEKRVRLSYTRAKMITFQMLAGKVKNFSCPS